ncbi:MAG: DUF2971 domain-containing protein [Rhodospirillales bacterium]|nr:DUF2971 domain-containing protein [Rhodospirillales bacterium]
MRKFDHSRTHHSPLWHYTTGQGAIDIIKSGELWVTQISCLNDSTELTYASDVLSYVGRQLLNNSGLSSELFRKIYERLITTMTVRDVRTVESPTYIGSFSEDGDDLSQWRAYGNGEGGIAIGFNVSDLKLPPETNCLLTKVEYDEQRQMAVAQRIWEATVDFADRHGGRRSALVYEAWLRTFLDHWAEQLIYIAPMFKHPSFHHEKEWRIVKKLDPDDMTDILVQQKNSMIRRHFALRFGPHVGDGKPRLPICAIRLGPTRHRRTSEAGIRAHLHAQGYDLNAITVDSSYAPLRSH